MKTKKEFETYFRSVIEKELPSNDKPALRQTWNDAIDNCIKDGTLPARAGNWSHPDRFYNRYELIGRGRKLKARKPYARKTKDEFDIIGHYPQGHEVVTTETTFKEANARLKEYRENEPGTSFRIKIKRVKIQATAN